MKTELYVEIGNNFEKATAICDAIRRTLLKDDYEVLPCMPRSGEYGVKVYTKSTGHALNALNKIDVAVAIYNSLNGK